MITNHVSKHVSNKPEFRSIDTPGWLRLLTKKAEGIIRELNAQDRDAVYEVLDFAIQKVTKCRDIMPHTNSLMKLRNGMVQREKRAKSRKIGEPRILTYKHINEGLQQLEDDEAEQKKHQLFAEVKKGAAEEKKSLQETLVAQWKAEVAVHKN